ncbi:D-psicose 3-epimerase [termite gut metagenome]|uniref:D-psicose 3-epimerase n=1 Tax=termite gut metagenome TaxID=433724 RepID=A0A5J4RMR5_9ZZZZ
MINARLGATILSWIHPLWNAEAGLYAIQQAAKTGFDLIEILLPVSMDIDAATVGKQLKEYNLEAVCGLNLSKEYHIPFYPKEATALIKAAIDKAAELEADYLGGVLHSAIGVFSGKRRTPAEEAILIDVWGEVADYAATFGITIGIEPINRYESYVCTGAEETLNLIHRVNAPNLKLHLDTFHMNIEEQSFYTPVKMAGSSLKHIHITENDRGLLGEGLVRWDDLFKALNEIDFEGNLVLENFSSSITGMSEAVSLWRPSKYDAQELAEKSLWFMQEKINSFKS